MGELIKLVGESGSVNTRVIVGTEATAYGSKQTNGQVWGRMNRIGLMRTRMNKWSYE